MSGNAINLILVARSTSALAIAAYDGVAAQAATIDIITVPVGGPAQGSRSRIHLLPPPAKPAPAEKVVRRAGSLRFVAQVTVSDMSVRGQGSVTLRRRSDAEMVLAYVVGQNAELRAEVAALRAEVAALRAEVRRLSGEHAHLRSVVETTAHSSRMGPRERGRRYSAV